MAGKGEYPKVDGDIYYGVEANYALEGVRITGLNTIRSLIDRVGVWSAGEIDGWGDAYIDADGRENSVTGAGAEFDTNKYKTVTSSTEPFIIIEATSLTESAFNVNNCSAIKISSGKWQVSCEVGTDEEKRAKLYNTIFGSGSSSNIITDATSVTAVKTNIIRDVGKRAVSSTASITATGSTLNTDWTGTFANTTTNDDCSTWSWVTSNDSSSAYARWEIPSGTILNNVTYGTSNRFNTDRSGDELNNPAHCQLQQSCSTTGAHGSALILCVGSISWVSGGSGTGTFTEYDTYDDGSIPLLTAITEDFSNFIIQDIPAGTFSSIINSAVGVPLIEDWETGAAIDFKLTGTAGAEDTGWISAKTQAIGTFTTFTAEPDTLIIRLTPKTTSPTSSFPSIKGFWVRTL